MGNRVVKLVGGREVSIKTSNKAAKGAPRSKRPGANNSPSRQRYWASGRLEKRKVKAIMRNNRISHAEASLLWHRTRKGRIKK